MQDNKNKDQLWKVSEKPFARVDCTITRQMKFNEDKCQATYLGKKTILMALSNHYHYRNMCCDWDVTRKMTAQWRIVVKKPNHELLRKVQTYCHSIYSWFTVTLNIACSRTSSSQNRMEKGGEKKKQKSNTDEQTQSVFKQKKC